MELCVKKVGIIFAKKVSRPLFFISILNIQI